jgi:chromosomal replication initiator protein
MSTPSQDLWSTVSSRLAAELPEQQFITWIRPLQAFATAVPPCPGGGPAVADGEAASAGEAAPLRLVLHAPNRFKLEWVRAQFAQRIAAVAAEVAERPVLIELDLPPRGATLASSAGSTAGHRLHRELPGSLAVADLARHALPLARGTDAGATDGGHGDADVDRQGQHLGQYATHHTGHRGTASNQAIQGGTDTAARGGGRIVAPPIPAHRLNPALTFDTLVAGRANQMARTAALHVAGAPGVMYNPLFIYGGVGLGKTHLVHAVGNALLKDRPDARVLYLHAEAFISDVVKNYQRKTFDELKAKYHHLDLLLIDDVQFFAGKERTQEEFFNAFEALLAKKAHIIMTSDTYPKGLVDIDERLTSRFDAGLTVAIEPPELEMRVAILIKKSLAEGTPMPEDVAFFIAKNVRANVRELEGALRKVLAYSRFKQKEIDITAAREALKDLLSIQNRQISVENIQKTVADFYKIKVADMYSKKRPASIARPRQIAMYLAKDMTKKSLPEIGELFGGRDHTTVLHAVRKIADERQTNSELNQQLHVLEQTLKG